MDDNNLLSSSSSASTMEVLTPYLAMVMSGLCLAVYIFLVRLVLSNSDNGFSPTVLVVYQNLLSSALLSALALLFDREKRWKLSLEFLAWSFLLGILQVPIGQLMFTASLQYITASFQSVGINLIPLLVFVLAVLIQREKFYFWGLYDQAKLWGVLLSAAGATVMVYATSGKDGSPNVSAYGWIVGTLMVGAAVLAEALYNILVELIALKYSVILTLSAMATVFGTLQTVCIAGLTEWNHSAWKIRWRGSLQPIVILYGGIVVTGLFYFVQNWCIQKKGPVFRTSFSPMVIVFSFALETSITRTKIYLPSIIGALLVTGGLYLLLWAKANDYKMENTGSRTCHYQNDDIKSIPMLVEELE